VLLANPVGIEKLRNEAPRPLSRTSRAGVTSPPQYAAPV